MATQAIPARDALSDRARSVARQGFGYVRVGALSDPRSARATGNAGGVPWALRVRSLKRSKNRRCFVGMGRRGVQRWLAGLLRQCLRRGSCCLLRGDPLSDDFGGIHRGCRPLRVKLKMCRARCYRGGGRRFVIREEFVGSETIRFKFGMFVVAASMVTTGLIPVGDTTPSVANDGGFATSGDFVPFTVTRLSGSNRFATGVAVSQEMYPSGAERVYVAMGYNFPDALTAGGG